MKIQFFLFCLAAYILTTPVINILFARSENPGIKHVTVYYEAGMGGYWPASYPVFARGDEILIGFSKVYYKDLGPERHAIDRDKPSYVRFARSLDGGETWRIETPKDSVFDHSVTLRNCNEGMHFHHPDFLLAASTNSVHAGQSRFWYSYDRGHRWKGPCRLPDFGTLGTAARTDYIIDGNRDMMLFLTVAKSSGREGRTMVAHTTDGGIEWSFRSWIGPEPDGFSIMPASVRLSDSELLVTVRRREGPKRFISAYKSGDNGRTWTYINDPANTGIGSPPAMIQLKDGRIALAYGYRSDHGSSLMITFSSDSGRTWGNAIELRGGDGADRDIGYPRMVQRTDGKLVILYYWNHALQENGAPYRYIASTIVNPDKLE